MWFLIFKIGTQRTSAGEARDMQETCCCQKMGTTKDVQTTPTSKALPQLSQKAAFCLSEKNARQYLSPYFVHMKLSVLFNYTYPAPSGHRKPREIHRNQWKQAKIAKNRPWSLLQAFLVLPVSPTKMKFSNAPLVAPNGRLEAPRAPRSTLGTLGALALVEP